MSVKRKNRIRYKVISLICVLTLLVMSAVPMFNRQSDAKLLGIIFGALASGVMLRDLAQELRDRKRKNKDK